MLEKDTLENGLIIIYLKKKKQRYHKIAKKLN